MGIAKTAPVDDHGRSAAASSKKRGAGIRAWLVVDSSGLPKLEELGKYLIMRRTGLPARDLRILDPLLSYPSRILPRDRAIVVNLEHIKAIITATEVLLLNSKDPLVAPFVHDLQSRIPNLRGSSPPPGGTESVGANMDLIDKDTVCPVRTVAESTLTSPPRARNSGRLQVPYKTCGDLTSMILPFEFRVLEVCLEFLCRCLESETSTLEQEAYPVLDELTSKISMLNLERVRQIKSRLVAISGRVQKVRDELEHLLDDDTHMAEMYLTNKLIHQEVDEISNDDLENDENSLDNERDQDPSSTNEKMRNNNEISSVTKLQIEDLEMLLEAYFVQIEGTLNKLSMTWNGYICGNRIEDGHASSRLSRKIGRCNCINKSGAELWIFSHVRSCHGPFTFSFSRLGNLRLGRPITVYAERHTSRLTFANNHPETVQAPVDPIAQFGSAAKMARTQVKRIC